jgi:hypothetical protein
MGTEIYVGTQTSRLIQDDKLPDSVSTGTIKAILRGEDIADMLMQEMLGCIGVKVDQMYEYAAKGQYVHGLPSSYLASNTQGAAEVAKILEAIEGAPVALEYSRLGALNFMHRAWPILIAEHNYDPVTNIMGNQTAVQPRGQTVYLHDMVLCVPKSQLDGYKPGVLDVLGTAPNAGFSMDRANPGEGSVLATVRKATPAAGDPTATSEYVLVTTSEATGYWDSTPDSEHSPQPITAMKTFRLELPALEYPDADYFYAGYSINGVRKWWTYRQGVGTYPTLDGLDDDAPVVSAQFYPLTYFRYEKKSEIEDKTTEAYKSTRNMLNKTGLNYDQLAEGIDANPDIKDVEQAFLMLGVPAKPESQIEMRYLFEFFSNLYNIKDAEFSTNHPELDRAYAQLNYGSNLNDGSNKVLLDIEDRRFHMRLQAHGIYKRIRGGAIGAVGTYTVSTGTDSYEYEYTDYESGAVVKSLGAVPYWTYCFQNISGLYTELKVYGLEMKYFVYGTKRTTSAENEKILMIPLDYSIVANYSILEREALYGRALNMIFNSVQIVKLKWYQSSWFSALIMIIAVVWTAISMGADGGSSITAALSLGSTAAVTVALLDIFWSLVFKMIVAMAVQYIGKKIGGVFAAVVAVALIMYGTFEFAQQGQVFLRSTLASNLLFVANNLVSGAMTAMNEDLLKDQNVFSELVSKATETLEDAKKLLDQNHRMTPYILFGESPGDFYNRTVHSGNIGVLGFEAVSSYVDNALTLPRLRESVGTGFEGSV